MTDKERIKQHAANLDFRALGDVLDRAQNSCNSDGTVDQQVWDVGKAVWRILGQIEDLKMYLPVYLKKLGEL